MTSTLDLLLDQVQDEQLRQRLIDEFAGLRRRTSYGLVFEDYADEAIRIPDARIKRGSTVQLREESGPRVWTVRRITDGVAAITRRGEEPREVPVADLIAARQLGDPVFTGLTPLGQIRQGGDKPAHLVIEGENYHALQTLLYTHEGKIDLIYIDPPYNTGAGDWIYNDRYVGDTDAYRHSKWLAFMDKRLRLARRLLSPTGVIIAAIDDNEHHRLRLLMDDVFGERNFISNVVWQGGRKNDSRYVSNSSDYMLIYARNEQALAERNTRWREDKSGVEEILAAGREAWSGSLTEALFAEFPAARERHALAIRSQSMEDPDQFHPGITPDWTITFISGLGPREQYAVRARAEALATSRFRAWWKSLPKDHPAQGSKHYSVIDGWSGNVCFPSDLRSPNPRPNLRYEVLHPLTGKPVVMNPNGWVYARGRMEELLTEGRIRFGADHSTTATFKRFLEETSSQVPMPTFESDRRASAAHLVSILGSKDFPFPKDVNVLARWINIAAANNPEAIILDFFGGTGTTAEAVMRLNAQDDGRRQAILVTNNELGQKDAKRLTKAGFAPGDLEWEAEGVFEKVTRPRLETVVTAMRRDGSSLTDSVVDAGGKKIASGIAGAAPLAENILFCRLSYLDRTDVELGTQFAQVALLLYAQAGGVGRVIETRPERFEVSDSYAILTDVAYRREFADAVNAAGVAHAYIVCNDAAQYRGAHALIDDTVTTHHLYEDYLVNFAINTGGAL